MSRALQVFSGSANRPLAEAICRCLGVRLGKAIVGRYRNGETRVRVDESVRGDDVYVIQPTSNPVNENLMELLIMLDALRRSSAARVTAVIPYYGYAKQEKKTAPREPITAKLVANLLVEAGA
ncbi:MAG TPA: ribose-phosphate pyrophosphokinase-like domain-containing protein, partial [Chloroflexia bacterium]